MKIKLVDISRQTENYREQIDAAIKKVIDRSDFILGEEVTLFEHAFANFCGRKYAISLNSGTDALKLALLAYGVGTGDEIITVPNSYFSTAMVITEIGATPVFVDVSEDTYTIDTTKIEHVITQKTKGIIPVHLYGQCCDMDAIASIAKKHNLFVLEDACQGHGAAYKGTKAPVMETAAFSFYPGKNLGCFGDGGILVTDNQEIAEKVTILRNDGAVKKYVHTAIGTKSRLDTLQAGILLVKLPFLEEWNEKRRKLATIYREQLSQLSEILLPQEASDRKHVYHLFVVRTKKRDLLQKHLEEQGIEVGIHYPIPIHKQEAYKGCFDGTYPVAEACSQEILSLPLFPELTEAEVIFVCDTIKTFFASQAP